MPGLLNQDVKESRGPVEPAGMQESKEPGEGIDYDAQAKDIQSRVPDDKKEAYTRLVVAGMKFLFAEEAQGMIDEYMAQPGPVGQKLGEGIASLMVVLDKESKGSMPKEMIIPAGIELVLQAAKYLQRSGDKIAPTDVSDAIETFMYKALGFYGVKPEQFDQFIEQNAQGAA